MSLCDVFLPRGAEDGEGRGGGDEAGATTTERCRIRRASFNHGFDFSGESTQTMIELVERPSCPSQATFRLGVRSKRALWISARHGGVSRGSVGNWHGCSRAMVWMPVSRSRLRRLLSVRQLGIASQNIQVFKRKAVDRARGAEKTRGRTIAAPPRAA